MRHNDETSRPPHACLDETFIGVHVMRSILFFPCKTLRAAASR
jgi:hypothetical protein